MRRTWRPTHPVSGVLLVALGMLAHARPAAAQLDPLLFLRREPPNLLLLVDTSPRMLHGVGNDYFDPFEYDAQDDAGMSLAGTRGPYRRQYVNLRHAPGPAPRFTAALVRGVPLGDPAYEGFHHRSRIGIARLAIAAAVRDNGQSVRFGLLAMRQADPVLPDAPNAGPVASDDPAQQSGGDLGGGAWAVTVPDVAAANATVGSVSPLVPPGGVAANTAIRTIVSRPWSEWRAGPTLLPAGRDGPGASDAPLAGLLEDARVAARRLIEDGPACRNTVAVLIAGGGEGTAPVEPRAPDVAATFRSLGGRRVPIYVLAILPSSEARAELQAIAAASGGQYFEVGEADVTSVAEQGHLSAVPVAVRAITTAVQHALAAPADVNAPPTVEKPFGPQTEFQMTGPVVGTVDLDGARYADGRVISDHHVRSTGGVELPQRGNVMVTAGFLLPGFEGRLRAYRLYRPRADAASGTGYTFVADGGVLWTAHAPAPDARNVFTVLPDGQMVAVIEGNAGRLAPYLATFDAEGLIAFVRAQPLGAVLGSVPAVLDAPSADVPPDAEFPAFAARHKIRRALVFVGANDGMLHAFDARTGLEVWAFVPFNLLPKLQTLRDGQAIDAFGSFVDGSPRLADVRVDRDGDGKTEWRTHLYVGQGAGGTFYHAFDVTLDDLAAAGVTPTAGADAVLAYFRDPRRLPWEWAFPRLSTFDPGLRREDEGLFGDVSALPPYGATDLELAVGHSWSTPAVHAGAGQHVLVVGSGFFPASREGASWRRSGSVRTGSTLFLLDAGSGVPLDRRVVPADGLAEATDGCAQAGDCRHQRQALQADPALVPAGAGARVYIGDLDGRMWHFEVQSGGGGPAFAGGGRVVFDAGPEHPLFGAVAVASVDGRQHLFFGSGSDLLPSAGVNGSYRLFGVVDGTPSPRFVRDLDPVTLAGAGERVSPSPVVAGDTVFFTTTSTGADRCAPPDAHVYAMTFLGGAAYDGDGDGVVLPGESPRAVTMPATGRATAPFVTDRHVIIGAGDGVSVLGDPEGFNLDFGGAGLRVLSWRHVH